MAISCYFSQTSLKCCLQQSGVGSALGRHWSISRPCMRGKWRPLFTRGMVWECQGLEHVNRIELRPSLARHGDISFHSLYFELHVACMKYLTTNTCLQTNAVCGSSSYNVQPGRQYMFLAYALALNFVPALASRGKPSSGNSAVIR